MCHWVDAGHLGYERGYKCCKGHVSMGDGELIITYQKLCPWCKTPITMDDCPPEETFRYDPNIKKWVDGNNKPI